MTETRKNQFEELIEAIIIDEVAGTDQEIRSKLESLPIDKKRIAILSILDKDRGLFMKIMKMVSDNDVTKVEHIRILVEQLRTYVSVGDFEKKSMGEVQTPWNLVQDLINCYPQEVWTNPNLKWLDNSTGTGILIAGVVERLMSGLSEWEPNDELRYKHIIENMIYVSELQSRNCFIFLVSFDPKDEYELNIYHGSFLDNGFNEHMKNVWGLDKFDVIVMNPPYQSGSGVSGSAHTLWDKFVFKSFDILISEGYLVAVHPDGWRSIKGAFKPVQKFLTNKEMIYLETHSRKDGLKNFGVQTTYDFYLIRNKINTGFKTKLKLNDGEIYNLDLRNLEFIPNGMFNELNNLIAKDGEEKVNLISTSSYHTQKNYVSSIQSEIFRYPCVYTINKNGEMKFKFSSLNNKGCFGIPKIIWSNGISKPMIDYNGDYMQTEFAYSICDQIENLINIQKAMLSERFIKLMSFSDGRDGHRYNHKIISMFRKDFWKEFLD